MEREILNKNSPLSRWDLMYLQLNLKSLQNKKLFSSLFLFSFLFLVLITSQTAFAFDDGFFWKFGSYPIDSSPAGTGKTNSFEIYDPNLDSNGNSEERLVVTVESKDTSGQLIETLDLLLTETNDEGLFAIDHMVFMLGDSEFDISDTVLITIEDNCTDVSDTDGNCDSNLIETLSGSLDQSVTIFSDTDSSGFVIDLVETGSNTGVFTGSVYFSENSSDSSNSILYVSEGDVITVRDQKTGSKTNGLISGDPNRFAIQTQVGGTVEVTATPDGSNLPITEEITITKGKSGGRGSGGLISPGLVADSPSKAGGGSGCNQCTPPTLGVGSNYIRLVDNGFSYNDNPVDVNFYYTPYPLVTVKVGQENKVVLKVYENSGPENIEHVGIGFGLGHGESFSDSKATINVDRIITGQNLITTFDPENVFENIRVNSEIGNCGNSKDNQCMIFTIFHTFREPLNFNMVSTYVWDSYGNAWQNYYNHGVHIFGDSLNPPKTKSVAFGSNDMRGLFTLTQIDKFNDKWIDEYGNIYLYKGNDRFDKISSIPKDKILDSLTMHGCDRLCNWFENYKENQELLATKELEHIMMGKEILNEQKGFIAAPLPTKIPRSEDHILQNNIIDEIKKATVVFEEFNVKNNF
jgi:hypothetical protein